MREFIFREEETSIPVKGKRLVLYAELVWCQDCKHWSAERINDYNKCRKWINVGVKNFATMGDWFCADGERKEGR